MLGKYPIFIVLALFCLLLSTPCLGQEIRVVTEEWKPYNYSSQGEVKGICTEIVKLSIKNAGFKIAGGKINIYPWARSYRIALSNENVLIYTILRNSRREKLFQWIGPLIRPEKFYFFKKRARDDVKVTSLSDAKKYQIGILRASIHEDFLLSKGFSKSTIQPVADHKLNLHKLLNERIDLIIDTLSSIKIRTKKMGLPLEQFERSLFLFKNDFYMAFSNKTDKAVVNRLKSAFTELKDRGVTCQILEKYN